MLDWLNRRIGRYAIPKLGLIIVLFQAVAYVADMGTPAGHLPLSNMLQLDLDQVRAGEVWRLVTFVIIPPPVSPLFVLCGLYFFWMMSSALEAQWGAFRFNVYLAVSWAMTLGTTVILALFDPTLMHANPQNAWMLGSVFLAFAWLWPNFVILLFFIIPVKIKYLALVTWLFYILTLATGSNLDRGLVVAAIANFLLFFGFDIVRRMRSGHRQMAAKVAEVRNAQIPFHRCAVCGVTETSDPTAHYRICAVCRPAREYCMVHLKEHQHVIAP